MSPASHIHDVKATREKNRQELARALAVANVMERLEYALALGPFTQAQLHGHADLIVRAVEALLKSDGGQ